MNDHPTKEHNEVQVHHKQLSRSVSGEDHRMARDLDFYPHNGEKKGEASFQRRALAVWDSRQIRRPYEFDELLAAVENAETEHELTLARHKLMLAKMEDDELTAARINLSLDSNFRRLADEEFEFRVNRAALEEAQERNRDLSIRKRETNTTRAGAFDAPARLVFEYIRTNKKRSPNGFYEWCRSLAECETLSLRGCEVITPKSTKTRRLDEVELEVTLEDTNGELLDDGIMVEGLGKFSSGSKQYSKRTLVRTYERYLKSKIF
ncbi:hypothetical protein C9928_01910 [Pseudidiomarina aestuarii]|uniref:Uncharacterized protein n=1 Tax=Pseudidiomarina aestuarii TaxID=624146 RepID=A0A6N4DGT0_9GAMM|nr:hypothetical protein C9928_01910 [Pseudidiomarina aestuarii]